MSWPCAFLYKQSGCQISQNKLVEILVEIKLYLYINLEGTNIFSYCLLYLQYDSAGYLLITYSNPSFYFILTTVLSIWTMLMEFFGPSFWLGLASGVPQKEITTRGEVRSEYLFLWVSPWKVVLCCPQLKLLLILKHLSLQDLLFWGSNNSFLSLSLLD